MHTLADYFTGLGTDDIRLVGHRIGIDDVLLYHQQGLAAHAIQHHLPSLSLEQIYATLTYYYAHQTEIDAYLARLAAWRERRQQEYDQHVAPILERLRRLQAQRTQVTP